MAGGELTLHPAAAYFGRQAAEFGLIAGLAAALAVVGYDATPVELTGSLTLGVLIYGVIELVTERDVIPRGRLLPVPSYARVTPPSGRSGLWLLTTGFAAAALLVVVAALLEGGAAYALAAPAAGVGAALVRLGFVRRWEHRHGGQQVVYGVDQTGEDRLYARPRPLTIGI